METYPSGWNTRICRIAFNETRLAIKAGDAPALELDVGIGDIIRSRTHRQAGSPYVFHRAWIEGQHQIQIMNHQIQDDIDVGTALTVDAHSLAFEQHRPSNVRPHHLRDRIEPLAVPDLQRASIALGQLHQLLSLDR